MFGNSDNQILQGIEKGGFEYSTYLQRLTQMACTRFKWSGLPDTIDVRYLELSLFSLGQAIVFKDEALGYLALKNTMQGSLNQYGIPKLRRAYGVNGYNKSLTDKDSVIVYNNYLHIGSYPTILEYAKRLAEIDQIIDINVEAQKTPILLQCPENQRLILKNLYAKYRGNAPFIFGDKTLDMTKLSVLKTDAPFNAPMLYDLKMKYWNEALTFLGIATGSDKRERMNVDEVAFNMGGSIACARTELESRQQACELMRKVFGDDFKDAECNYNFDYMENISVSEEETEVNGNE